MSKKRTYNTRLVAAVIALIVTILALFGSASFDSYPLLFQLGVPAIIGIGTFYLFEIALRRNNEDGTLNKSLAKTIALLVLVSLVVCVYSAIKSLWMSPSIDVYFNRFVYENIATGFGFAAIVLALILSTLQRDVYWVAQSKSLKLDERQTKERQQVFELSYKIAAFLVLGAAAYCADTFYLIPAIIANNYGTLPGHLLWLPYSVVIALFALPLIVAAWKKR